MGLFDALLGRTKQVQPNLDALFSLPGAALTLEAAAEIRPTGVGAVCFREAEGGPFARLKDEITALLGGSEPEEVRDDYGYTWLVVRRPADDVLSLVTDLHAVTPHSSRPDSGHRCCARPSGCAASPDTAGAGVPLHAGHVLPYLFAPVDAATQRRDSAWRYRCGPWWSATCRSARRDPVVPGLGRSRLAFDRCC